MKILIVSNNGISKEVINENEKEYHIPVIIDEQTEKECCYVSANIQDNEELTFLLFSDQRSEELDYDFTSEDIEKFTVMIDEYEIKRLARLEIECIKEVNDLGYADFLEGKFYWVESVDENDKTCYIESEDGSAVQFEFDEIKTYFKIR